MCGRSTWAGLMGFTGVWQCGMSGPRGCARGAVGRHGEEMRKG